MPQTDMITSLVRGWISSLAVLVVWAVGLVVAIGRRREHPRVAMLVMASCALGLLTSLLMPVVMSVGYRIGFGFIPPLLSFTGTCLAALSIGLLLYAAFLGRGQRALDAVERPEIIVPAAPSGPGGTALRILAGIVRWTWRVCSIALTLFVGTFLLAGLSEMHISTDPEDLAAIFVGVFLFAAMILAWWHEGLWGLIILLTGLVVAGVSAIGNWHRGMNAGQMIAAGRDGLGPAVMPLLMVLSWSLHTLTERTAAPRKRRLALIAAPVLAVAIAFCVRGMFPLRFNP